MAAMQQTNWIVLTGGPSSGKTCTISYLKDLGYATTVESARVLIDQEIAKGRTLEQVRAGGEAFQQEILCMKELLEREIPPDRLTFFDRGVPDSIAYYRADGYDVAPVLHASRQRRYRAVFHLDQLPFEKDYARMEDEEEADKLSRQLFSAYTDLGYDVVRVPIASVEERAAQILREIQKS
jgi:predicted ATPase